MGLFYLEVVCANPQRPVWAHPCSCVLASIEGTRTLAAIVFSIKCEHCTWVIIISVCWHDLWALVMDE